MKQWKSIIVVLMAALCTARGTWAEERAAASRAVEELEGSWLFTITIPNVPAGFPNTFRSLITFIPGGSLINLAWSPTLPILISKSPWIGHGAWARTGDNEFGLTVIYPRFDASGAFIGSGKGRGNLLVSEGASEASGTFAVDLYDANGNLFVSGGGSVQATRIVVEPVGTRSEGLNPASALAGAAVPKR